MSTEGIGSEKWVEKMPLKLSKYLLGSKQLNSRRGIYQRLSNMIIVSQAPGKIQKLVEKSRKKSVQLHLNRIQMLVERVISFLGKHVRGDSNPHGSFDVKRADFCFGEIYKTKGKYILGNIDSAMADKNF